MKSAVAILISLQLAMAPAYADINTRAGEPVATPAAAAPSEFDNLPPALQSVTETTAPDGTKILNDQIIITADPSNNEQMRQIIAFAADQMIKNQDSGHTVPTQVIATVPENVDGEILVEKLQEAGILKGESNETVLRVSEEKIEGYRSFFSKVGAAFKRALPGTYRVTFGVSRAYINGTIAANLYHAAMDIPLGPNIQANLPFLGETSMLGIGPAWQGALAAASLSGLITIAEYRDTAKNRALKRVGKNIFSHWLVSSGHTLGYFAKAMRGYFKKFQPAAKTETVESVVASAELIEKYGLTELIFVGVPTAIYLAHGYATQPTVIGAIATFLGASIVGVFSQLNLDTYVAKVQEHIYEKFGQAGSFQRAMAIFWYYVRVLGISVSATAATTLANGVSEWVGWISTGVLFGTGLYLNNRITKKLKDVRASKNISPCAAAFKSSSANDEASPEFFKDTGS